MSNCPYCCWIDPEQLEADEVDGPMNYCRVCGRDLRVPETAQICGGGRMIYESKRKMTYKEQEAYDLGYMNGKHAAMCIPWVKTSDRLPTKADAGVDEEIVTIYDDGETRIMSTDYWAFVATVPERFPYWLPVPKLPEVEE